MAKPKQAKQKAKKTGNKKSARTSRSLAATIGAIAALVLFIVTLIIMDIMSRKEMTCSSSKGTITLNYNDKLIGYTANGVSYDFKAQQEYANKIGIDTYLTEFEQWFKDNTDDGVCERK